MQKLILCAIILLLSINQARAAKDEPTPATSAYVSLSDSMVLSEQKASDIKSPENREEIRRQATAQVQLLIADLSGNKDVSDILFSSNLVQ